MCVFCVFLQQRTIYISLPKQTCCFSGDSLVFSSSECRFVLLGRILHLNCLVLKQFEGRGDLIILVACAKGGA